jgi:hypothetical protein
MRTLVLVVSALIALSSCMQQNTAENTEQTTPGTTVQPQTTNNTPATNLVTTQDPKTVTITTGTTTPSGLHGKTPKGIK